MEFIQSLNKLLRENFFPIFIEEVTIFFEKFSFLLRYRKQGHNFAELTGEISIISHKRFQVIPRID